MFSTALAVDGLEKKIDEICLRLARLEVLIEERTLRVIHTNHEQKLVEKRIGE